MAPRQEGPFECAHDKIRDFLLVLVSMTMKQTAVKRIAI